MLYVIDYVPDDNGTLLATSPQFPELTTFGEDVPHVYLHALGAIEEAIAARIAAGSEIPAPSSAAERKAIGEKNDGSGRIWIKLPALTVLKVQLYQALRGDDVSRAELARRLGWNRESVDRLFRLDHRSRLEQIEAALAAIGRQVDVAVTAAAKAPTRARPLASHPGLP